MNNKKIGNNTENEFLEKMQGNGYWTHLLAYNSYGQPFDIIAVRKNIILMLDVKHCSIDNFSFNNIQENQKMSMAYAVNRCLVNPKHIGFAIYFEEVKEWYFMSYEYYQDIINADIRKSLNRRNLIKFDEYLEILKNEINNQQ